MKEIFKLIIAALIFSINVNGQTRQWAFYYGTPNVDQGQRMASDASNIAMCGFVVPGASAEGFWQKYSYAGVMGSSHTTAGGGLGRDYTGIDIDLSGNIYTIGYTNNVGGLTTPGVYQTTFGGGNYDLIIQKFSPTGTLIWGTFFGGPADEYSGLSGIKVDNAGNVYIASHSNSSTGIATVGAFQPTLDPGGDDGVLAKFNPNGTLAWATYFGGFGFDCFTSIDLDASGNIYASGYFNSTGLAFNGYQSASAGETSFITKFSNSGSRIWASYLGGGGRSYGIKCNSTGTDVYMSGFSTSSAFIPYKGFQMTYGGGLYDGYVVKFTSSGSRVWGTYFGGTGRDQSMGITLDASENVFASGLSASTTGMGFNGYQMTYGGGAYDATILKLDSACTRIYSSYYGGTNDDNGLDAHIDSQNNLYLSGYTNSTNAISTSGSLAGNYDGFIVKFSNPCTLPSQPGTISGLNSICAGAGTTTYSVASVAGATSYTWSLPGIGWTGTSTTNTISVNTGTTSGNISVAAVNACGTGSTSVLSITVNPPPPVAISGPTTVCKGSSVTLTASGANSYAWYTGPITATILVSPSVNTTYTVDGLSIAGCTNTAMFTLSVIPTPTVTISGTNYICSGTGGSVTLTSNGANTYTWSTTATTNSIIVSPTVTTSYTVTGAAVNGCTSSAVQSVSIAPLPTVTISGLNSICFNTGTTLTAISGASNFTWSPGGQTSPSILISQTVTSTYTVVVSDPNGCQNTTTKTVSVNPLPTVTANTTNSVICGPPFQGTATLNAGGASTYTWNPGGAGASIAVSPSVTSTYTLTGTDVNGCVNSTVITQSVSMCAGVQQLGVVSPGLVVYPNPTSGALVILSASEESASIELYNAVGERLLVSELRTTTTQLNLSDYPNGIYFLRVGNITKKIIKE